VEFLLSRSCDALILRLDSVSDEFLVELGARDKTPFVVLDREVPGIMDRCIFLDNELGGYLATRSVLVLGHRKIAYISGPLRKGDASGRLAGHKRALEEHGIEFDSRLVYEGNFQEEGGNRGMERLLASGVPFSAVVCANDEMAAGAFGVARERGMVIPEEMSIMGFDNVFFTRYFRPKLSTINNPVSEMGQMAARLILKEVYGQENLSIQHRYEPTLVNRSSVAARFTS
jgi:LacI family transcriptional regulator